ncbi:hypothetical protein [Breznakiella homolactica]|uniref:Outer membrane protein beta-barrel domain-containing protein n=1 Tax=Breznakiella homolactica TaxID=2798577 RepID=A0A7T7XP40_9SPIR|nr:hypothetical protein [Breznakiella homolactica]QQO09915.1 hypothetical protein JFL75_03110 [Breznakiella homolactica]
MKRYLLLLLGVLLACTGVFAAEFNMSFGGGFEFFGNFTTAETQADYGVAGDPWNPPGVILTKSEQTVTDLNYGGFLFFDATYAEVFVSFYGGSTKLENTNNMYVLANGAPTGYPAVEDVYEKITASMSIGILGKYPFVFNKFTVAPMVGVSYQIFFGGVYGSDFKEDNPTKLDPSDFNTLWFHAGAGVNYDLTDSMYIKAEALYGFKLMANGYDDKNKDYVEGHPEGELVNGWVNTVTARVGVGFKI